MSTKSTIAYHNPDTEAEDDFHFYHECFEMDGRVYLEIEGRDLVYEACKHSVTVCIPAAVWETIRTLAPVDMSWAALSDAEVETRVAEILDADLAKYGDEYKQGGIMGLAGSGVFGDRTAPREQQFQRGVEYYKNIRDEQTEIKRKVDLYWKRPNAA